MALFKNEIIENKTFDEIKIGDSASLEKTLTDEDVRLFAKVSGDVNPLHLDEEYAKTSMFKGRVAHGMWGAGLISAVMGTKLPGAGGIYLNQSLSFRRPVKIGDTIRVEVTVTKKDPEKNRLTLDCKCINQNQETVIVGEAEAIAATEKITCEAATLPDVDVLYPLAKLKTLVNEAYKYNKTKFKVAAVYPISEEPIAGTILAAEEGLIEPVFIGPLDIMKETAKKLGKDVTKYECIDLPTSGAAAKQAVELAKNDEVHTIMKGDIHSDELLRSVISGLRTSRRLSHISVADIPLYHKILLFTDTAVNVTPDLRAKVDILQNVIDFAQCALGIEKPKVAILSAVETVSDKMQSAVDAAILCKMVDRGQIKGAIVDGPVSFDIISKEATEAKHFPTPMAGEPDVYLAPDLDTANGVVKTAVYLAHARGGAYVLGAKVPIILIGRYTANPLDRAVSCALAKLYYVKHNKLA